LGKTCNRKLKFKKHKYTKHHSTKSMVVELQAEALSAPADVPQFVQLHSEDVGKGVAPSEEYFDDLIKSYDREKFVEDMSSVLSVRDEELSPVLASHSAEPPLADSNAKFAVSPDQVLQQIAREQRWSHDRIKKKSFSSIHCRSPRLPEQDGQAVSCS
jgi:hypothetical protein